MLIGKRRHEHELPSHSLIPFPVQQLKAAESRERAEKHSSIFHSAPSVLADPGPGTVDRVGTLDSGHLQHDLASSIVDALASFAWYDMVFHSALSSAKFVGLFYHP